MVEAPKCEKCGGYKKLLNTSDDRIRFRCPACKKKYDDERFERLSKDPIWVERQMELNRAASRRHMASPSFRREKSWRQKAEVNYATKYPERVEAKNQVLQALQKGIIQKQPCSVCGDKKSQAHHDDYSKPLDVVWFCARHHHERHVELRKLARLRAAGLVNP